jgi:purine-binding chemotaxis protein CheW
MALGKNLKKKNLIPTAPVSKGIVVEKDKVEEVAEPSYTQEVEVMPLAAPIKSIPQVKKMESTAKGPEYRQLDQKEFDRRIELHDKFKKEVEAINDKKVHLIIFKVDKEEFAIEIDKIREVVPTPAITKMPQSPSYVPGIATIRGKAIVTIDLTKKFGYSNSSDEQSFTYTMIVSTKKFTIGILINEVPVNQLVSGAVVQSTADDLSETTLDETYIKGMIKLDGRVVFLMDIDELVEGDRLKNRVSAGINQSR